MSYQSFEDLDIWKQSFQLCKETYKAVSNLKDFSLKDQIQRSAVSVPSNISEGYERGTNQEFIRFLYISRGSSGELRTQIRLATEMGLISKQTGKHIEESTRILSAKIYKLIKHRESLK